MRRLTVRVDEAVCRDFQEHARLHGRAVSEIIREAMEDYRVRRIQRRTSLKDLRPASVGKVLRPFTGAEDLLEELTKGQGG